MRKQILMPILLSAARKIGLNIFVEPTRGIYGVIIFDSGKKYYIKDINFNLNLSASTSLAKNKAATSFFLENFGYNVPKFTMIYSDKKCYKFKSKDTVQEGLIYSNLVGFPVILKPNNMSQGSFVFKANDEHEYFYFASEIFNYCDTAQVQKFYSGNDYRIVVLGGEILSAYQRIPFHVIGDNNASIAELVNRKQQQFINSGRDTKLVNTDIRLAHKLRQQNLSLVSIPLLGEKVVLQDISNLSVGGETIELTNNIHNSFKKLALMIARDTNLTLCGIDIITNDITEVNDGNYVVIEVNSSPGLDNYAYTGVKQELYVEKLYQDVLLYIKNTYS